MFYKQFIFVKTNLKTNFKFQVYYNKETLVIYIQIQIL
jgi:hypothetical protein